MNLAVFLASFCVLAYELAFMRIFSFAQWHNLSSLIITTALMGWGLSGTAVALVRGRLRKSPRAWNGHLQLCLLMLPLSMGLGFIMASGLTFNPYEMSLDLKQVLFFCLYFALMALPFLWGGAVVCIAFVLQPAAPTYFFNLLGSGTGTLAVLGGSFFLHPYDLAGWVGVISIVPALLHAFSTRASAASKIITVLACLTVGAALTIRTPESTWVSQFKPLSAALTLPDARIIHEACSPLSVVQVVEAEGLRSTAGLSLACPFQVPVQKGLFFNGGGMTPVTPYDGSPDNAGYVRWLSSFLPFFAMPDPGAKSALIVGAGGGQSLLQARAAGFKTIHGVEADANVIALMTGPLAEFSGGIYTRPGVQVFHGDARPFIRQAPIPYDLIDISLVDSFNAAASGVFALNENYLYTREALQEFLSRLTPGGILSLTRWITTPPRDNIKLMNTAIAALTHMGVQAPGSHLMAIRSLQTLTLLVSPRPLPKALVDRGKAFARRCLFDLVWAPGIRAQATNRFIRMKEPAYFNAAAALLSKERRQYEIGYPFDITPATDNRPYFYNFFKPAVLDYILKFGPAQVPITEWGYLVLVILLVPVSGVSCLMILVPLVLSGRPARAIRLLPYFALTGLGFFFIEMPMIQKLVKFLGHPAYSISITLAGLLLFSGLGALYSDRLLGRRATRTRRLHIAILAILAATLFFAFGSDALLSLAAAWPLAGKMALVLGMLALPGYFMGIPFPLGLEQVRKSRPELVPLAFGINGFFSVAAILLAALGAVLSGFNWVLAGAAVSYAGAGIAWHGLRQ